MKAIFGAFLMLLLGVMGIGQKAAAQSQEAQQLLLDVTKLTQFKQILKDLKAGYEIVSKGYSTIKSISEGSFSLHKTFLDGLMEVSPVVKKYKRVTDIINLQVGLVKEYKSAFSRFKGLNLFNDGEIAYLSNVYKGLFDQSVKSLEDLATVITAGKLRMNDAERLSSIDQIYESMQDRMAFLKHFNVSAQTLAVQRTKEQGDINIMRKLYDVK